MRACAMHRMYAPAATAAESGPAAVRRRPAHTRTIESAGAKTAVSETARLRLDDKEVLAFIKKNGGSKSK